MGFCFRPTFFFHFGLFETLTFGLLSFLSPWREFSQEPFYPVHIFMFLIIIMGFCFRPTFFFDFGLFNKFILGLLSFLSPWRDFLRETFHPVHLFMFLIIIIIGFCFRPTFFFYFSLFNKFILGLLSFLSPWRDFLREPFHLVHIFMFLIIIMGFCFRPTFFFYFSLFNKFILGLLSFLSPWRDF
jgi:hypothetical protein